MRKRRSTVKYTELLPPGNPVVNVYSMKGKPTGFRKSMTGTVSDIGLSQVIQMLCLFLLGHIVIIAFGGCDDLKSHFTTWPYLGLLFNINPKTNVVETLLVGATK